MISLFEKRVHDIAACTHNRVKVHLNGKRIKILEVSMLNNNEISLYNEFDKKLSVL